MMLNANPLPLAGAPASSPAFAAIHGHLDARLAATFLRTTWGESDEAGRELALYRVECAQHLAEAEKRLFARLDHIDARTLALERLEWRRHLREIQDVTDLLARELSRPGSALSSIFGALRRAEQRQRGQEARLQALARTANAIEA